MARGLRCKVCNQPMYGREDKYEPQGTWVTYICRNGNCDNYKRSGYAFQEKKFEPK